MEWTTIVGKNRTKKTTGSKRPLPILQSHDRGNVEVRPSLLGERAGLGLFSSRAFAKGDAICSYTGQLCGAKGGAGRSPHGYIFQLSQGVCIDAGTCFEVAARYVNDNANTRLLNASFKKEPRARRAVLIATRDISTGEELYASYGKHYWPDLSSGRIPPKAPAVRLSNQRT